MKPELKRQLEIALCNYLPYGLKIWFHHQERSYALTSDTSNQIFVQIAHVVQNKGKPILHPLSDLTKEIEHNGEKFVPADKINELFGKKRHHTRIVITDNSSKTFKMAIRIEGTGYYALPYEAYQKLFEWHFDVHDLIDAGCAIDINTLNH